MNIDFFGALVEMRHFAHLIVFFSLLIANQELEAQGLNNLGKLPWFRCLSDYGEENDISRAAAPFAIAAEHVYTRCREEYEPIPFPHTKTESWTQLEFCVSQQDKKLGFYAEAWIRNSSLGKQVVIAFRGTQFTEIRDWTRGNLAMVRCFPWRTQFDAALDYADQVTSKYSRIPVVFTGHSLGGGLAEYCQRFIPNSKALVFHPSPNQGRLFGIGSNRKKYEKHVLRLFEKGELLRPFRWLLCSWNKTAVSGEINGVRGRWIDFRKGNPLTQHYMTTFTIDIVRQAALANDESARSVLDQIADEREKGGKEQKVDRWWHQVRTSNGDDARMRCCEPKPTD